MKQNFLTLVILGFALLALPAYAEKSVTGKEAVAMNNADALSAFAAGGAQALSAKPLESLSRKLEAKHKAAANLHESLLAPYSDGVSGSNIEDRKAREQAKKLMKRYGAAKKLVNGLAKKSLYGGIAFYALGLERILHNRLVLSSRPADEAICGDFKLECAERSLLGKIFISRTPVKRAAAEAQLNSSAGESQTVR